MDILYNVNGLLEYTTPYVIQVCELVIPLILFICWLFAVFLFVILPYYKYRIGPNWKKMSDEEYFEFNYDNPSNDNILKMKTNDFFYGTGADENDIGGY